jgi:excisionase family DNA binding protein
MKQILLQATISVDEYMLGFQPGATTPGVWVTAEAAAAILNCSGRTIRRMCVDGKLRHTKAGNRYRVHASELALTGRPQGVASVRQTPPPASVSPSARPPAKEPAPAQPERPPGEGWVQKRPGGPWSRSPLGTPEESRVYEIMKGMQLNKQTGRWEYRGKPLR